MRQHKPRHAVGQRGLADAWLAADQPRVRHAGAAIGRQELVFGFDMTEERERLARMRQVGFRAGRTYGHHTSSNAAGAVAGSNRAVDLGPDRAGDVFLRATGIDNDATLRIFRRDLADRRRADGRESRAPHPQTGRRFRRRAARGCARKPLARIDIQNEGQVRNHVADGVPFQRLDQPRVNIAKRALIGAGRINVAVAHDPVSVRKRRRNRVRM